MNTPVSYPIAKLLQEKGFEVKVRPKYYFDKSSHIGSYMYNANGELKLCTMPDVGLRNGWIDSPTIADVVMWLYEKHGIWISVSITIQKEYYYQCIDITGKKDSTKNNYPSRICKPGNYYNSPTESYEAAFEYILNNLI